MIVLEDWKQEGKIRYRIVLEKDLAEIVATLSDEELQTINQNINKDPVTLHDIKEHIKSGKFKISKKTEAQVYNILKKRGYNNKHIAKIMSYLREIGYFSSGGTTK